MRAVAAFNVALLSAGLGSAQGGWVDLPSLNIARQETAAARVGERIYVMGGLLAGPALEATPTVEVYDSSTGMPWSFVAPMPVGLDHAAAASLGGKIHVIGGFSADFVARTEVYRYDPLTDSWSTGTPLPAARGAAWAAVHGGTIYLFGGTGPGGDSASTFAYDPATDAWSTLADMPTAREHLNAATVGNYIYVVGGRSTGSTDVNERYDPSTDTWATMASMSAVRSAMGMAALQGKLYAGGGEIPVLSNLFEVYDPFTNAWTMLPQMPVPRHGVAAVAVSGMIVFPGGGRVQGLLPSVRVNAYRPQAFSVPIASGSALATLGLLLVTAGWWLVRRTARA